MVTIHMVGSRAGMWMEPEVNCATTESCRTIMAACDVIPNSSAFDGAREHACLSLNRLR